MTSLLDIFSDVSHATPVLSSDQSVFESESYAASPSGDVDSSPASDAPVLPASTSTTVYPANLSFPLLAVLPLMVSVQHIRVAHMTVSPGGTSTSVSPASSSGPISAASPSGVVGLSPTSGSHVSSELVL